VLHRGANQDKSGPRPSGQNFPRFWQFAGSVCPPVDSLGPIDTEGKVCPVYCSVFGPTFDPTFGPIFGRIFRRNFGIVLNPVFGPVVPVLSVE
jgi:hypothetical protein